MAQATAIGWTDLSWNPVHGCSIVSTECRNCYAATLSLRYRQTQKPWTPANAAENVLLKPHKLREPLSGAKAWRGLGAAAAASGKTDGMLVFVNSMSDLFHERVPDEFIARVFATMAVADRHTFQVLTKRPERMRDVLTSDGFWPTVADELERIGVDPDDAAVLSSTHGSAVWLPNVWLGVSVGLRQFVGRADLLRETPAAVRFISAEPLLGPLVHDVHEAWEEAEGREWGWPSEWSDGHDGPQLDTRGIDWVIVGGESGPDHRPMELQWARDLLSESREHGAAFFMKQAGGSRPGTPLADLPEDLRVREFPKSIQRRVEA